MSWYNLEIHSSWSFATCIQVKLDSWKLKLWNFNEICKPGSGLWKISWNQIFRQWERIHEISTIHVGKTKNSLSLEKIREINSLVKTLLSRNFCQKSVWVNFRTYINSALCRNSFSHFFRESNVLTKEVTKELISRKKREKKIRNFYTVKSKFEISLVSTFW